MFIKQSLETYIDKTNSKASVPGGGSVSALVGALGASLSNMVGYLSKDKKAFLNHRKEDQEQFLRAMLEQEEVIQELKIYVDKDTKAFDSVLQALKLPKTTREEKVLRNEKIQAGYKIALESSFHIARLCLKALQCEKIFAKLGSDMAISDVGVGTVLLCAALEGALFNVRINVAAIHDTIYREEVYARIEQYMERMQEIREDVLHMVYERIEG